VGATHAAALARTTVEHGADLGLAFDGDGDRLIAVDHQGNVVDGDNLIALLAADLRAQGRLSHDTVVVTVMSNLGFHKAMAAEGISVVTTAVGDRYVLEGLGEGGFSLGGEQSGHIIIPEFATTGDGLLAGLLLIDYVQRSGRSLADLAGAAMQSYPQVLINTRVRRPWAEIADEVRPDIVAVEAELGGEGRVLVRPSGTEPLVRVMVEAANDELARSSAQRIIAAIVRAGS
jgi:phosphoglucosamine mutase